MDFTYLKNFLDHMAMSHTPGNAVEVYLDGKLVLHYACGYSELETKKKMTGYENFNIYSCSKIATVTAGMQLLEQGKFLLCDPLYDYIPEFKEMYVKDSEGRITKAHKPITIRDLFCMTAGFSYDLESAGFMKAKEKTNGKMDTIETIRCIASDYLSFEPGDKWQYGVCHDILAAVISVVSGKKFRDYVKECIFEPLNMTESFYHPTENIMKNMAEQYTFIPEGGTVTDIVEAQKSGNAKQGYYKNTGKGNRFILGEEYDSGGAGIITTLSDYTKLIAALANFGNGLTGERILSSYSVNMMRTNHLSEEQKKGFNWKQMSGCGYGLGVRTHISKKESGLICNLGEFGWGGAAGATAIIDPQINLGVFYIQHTLNPREEYYQPRLRNAVYSCLS